MDLIILPDHPEAARLLGENHGRVVPHHSGRPWLAGRWAEEDLTLVTAGARRLAVFGRTRLDAGAVARTLAVIQSPYDLDGLATRLPGGVHLVASLDGAVRAQGSVSTARQFFVGTAHGIDIAAADPARLAVLTGASIDETALALRLLTPTAPWPLNQRGIWSGVRPVTAGHWLWLGWDGTSREVRWWEPPVPELPLAEAAQAVRTALAEAVSVRVRRPDPVSVDLSGGLDSTSLCFLVAAERPDLITFHGTPLDRANDDTRFATRAAELLPHGRHHTFPTGRHASLFDVDAAQLAATDAGEGPPLWAAGAAHLAELSTAAAAEGSRLHLMGLGGDELFGAVPAYLWSLVRRHPVASLPVVRRSRLLNRWRLGATVRALADRTDFAESLSAALGTLTAPPPRPPVLNLGWVGPVRVPPWATPHAVALVRAHVQELVAGDVRPLDGDRFRHQVLDSLGYEGTLIRQTRRGLAGFGLEWDAPMLDDRVVEAALSVRLTDRVPRGRYKPLLVAAMAGVVPDSVRLRRTKGEFSAELYEGLRHHRAKFLETCADLRLADLGLVDPAALRSALLSPAPESRHLTPFENTMACENWLRTRHLVGEPT